MRKLNMLIAGAVTALALLADGCGGDDNGAPAPDEGSQAVSPGGGALVVPDTFLTYEGERFELIQFLQADFEDESEFSPIGETDELDIDHDGPQTVYERDGDPDAVYTLSPKTVDDVAFWLRWQEE